MAVARLVTAASVLFGLLAVGSPRAGAQRTAAVPARTIVGYSVRHRPIIAYHLGDRSSTRSALIIGQMHGDEHAGVIVADSIVHGAWSVTGINLWVIPTMNPDGDAAHTRQNAHHVDLNRNWPFRWRHLSGQYYSGRAPLSEPETRAVHRFLVAHRVQYLVSLHQPLHGVDTHSGGPRQRAFARALARYLHLPSTPLRCWSVCHGSMTDWYSARKLGIAETVEFGWHPSHAYLVGTARRGIIRALHARLVPRPAAVPPRSAVASNT